MMSPPAVSVLIPVFNCGPYLDASIASILNQSLRDIEVVVVNDGSTDGSGERLEAIAGVDSRVRVIHVPNGGIVTALNIGLALVRAPYVARMDGDDIAWPERLKKQRDFLDARPEHVGVGSLYRMIDGEGKVEHVQRPTDQRRQTDLNIFPPFIRTVPHPTLMVRVDAMRCLGGYRSFFPHAEDHDLFLRLATFGGLSVLPEVLLDYRVHAGAVSGRNRQLQIDSALAAQKAAMVLARTGVDPLAGGDVNAIDKAAAKAPGVPGAAAWRALHALYLLDHNLDRRHPRAALRALVLLLGRLSAGAPTLLREGALAGIVRRTLRGIARLGYISVWN